MMVKTQKTFWITVSVWLLICRVCPDAAVGQTETAFLSGKAKPAALQAYNADPAAVSISGLSSGGFMAVQLGVAYSSVFTRGFGVFAGGPYDCARNQKYTACMKNSVPDITKPQSNMARWSGSKIDPLKNLAERKIFMWVGTKDRIAGPNVMRMLDKELSTWYSRDKVSYKESDAGHTFPTDFKSPGNSPCGEAEKPFVSNCGYDGAGEVLKWLYGKLNGRNDNPPARQLISFDQTFFIADGKGMDSAGYLYVPAACAAGKPCRLHVALHGCEQGHGHVQMKFVNNSGYNRWADTNNIIILYPQARRDYKFHRTWSSGYLPNPAGCWDWVGWYGEDADRHGGAQIEAIVGMVRKITSGYKK
ncbi:MAG: PHB depolymerase family esterase [Syntrophaceae bacterium]